MLVCCGACIAVRFARKVTGNSRRGEKMRGGNVLLKRKNVGKTSGKAIFFLSFLHAA